MSEVDYKDMLNDLINDLKSGKVKNLIDDLEKRKKIKDNLIIKKKNI